MANLTRSQEREERTKMGRGMLISVFGLIFCWVPLLGLLLSSWGFVKVSMRLTDHHRARYAAYFSTTLLILAACTGALLGEVYWYSVNPNFPSESGMWLITKLTGQALPEASDAANYAGGGTDYSGMTVPGMGIDPSLYDSNGAQGQAQTPEGEGQVTGDQGQSTTGGEGQVTGGEGQITGGEGQVTGGEGQVTGTEPTPEPTEVVPAG